MSTVIACIDGSAHADDVSALSAWAARRLNLPITLLHVQAPHAGHASTGDLSGTLGFGGNSRLLEQLTELDEARGRLEQRKGRLILEHAQEGLRVLGIDEVQLLHRRGSLVETLNELEAGVELIVIGKRGEQAATNPAHLGSNLERVARAARHPLLVTGQKTGPIDRFLLAYDGGASTDRAVDFIANSSLLRGLVAHLLTVSEPRGAAEASLRSAAGRLSAAGFTVEASLQHEKHVEEAVADYITAHDIDLLIIGAYGHSRIRSLILGSTTTTLLRLVTVPVLLFR